MQIINGAHSEGMSAPLLSSRGIPMPERIEVVPSL